MPPVLTRFIFPSGPLCLGVCIGEPQAANLGDGHGLVNQTFELREGEGELEIIDRGSLYEDPSGVNYLRLFRQNGPTANTGALFLAYVCPVFPSRLFFVMRGVATDRFYQGFPDRGGVFLTGIFDLFSDYCNMLTGRL